MPSTYHLPWQAHGIWWVRVIFAEGVDRRPVSLIGWNIPEWTAEDPHPAPVYSLAWSGNPAAHNIRVVIFNLLLVIFVTLRAADNHSILSYFIVGFNAISLILHIVNPCRCDFLAILYDVCALPNILLLQAAPRYLRLSFVIHTWSFVAKMLAHVWDSIVDTSIKKYQEISPTQMQGMWRCELPAGYSSELYGDMSHLYQLVLQQRRANPPHGKWIAFCLFCFY